MTESPENPADRLGHRLYRAAQFAVVALCLATFWRVHSYALGSDPAYYLAQARALADQIGAGQMPRLFIAPVFPLLLALLRLTAGPFAPYWINLLFWPGALLLLMRLLRRSGAAPGVAGFAGLLVPVWLGLADTMHANFLLHPFREPAALFFLLAAGNVAVDSGGRTGRLLTAGLLGLLAAGTREPFAVGLLSLVVFAASEPKGVSRGERIRRAGLMLLPTVLAATAALSLPGVRAALAGGQAMMYLRRIGDAPPGALPFLQAAARLTVLLGVAGLPLAALGAWRHRARRAAPVLLGLTGLLLLVAHAPIRDHARYALVAAVFWLPLTALGLAVVAARIPARAQFALAALLVPAAVCSLRGLHPWGPVVHAHEVRRFVAELPQENIRGYTCDVQARPLTTLLTQFAPRPLLKLAEAAPRPDGVLLLDTLTPEAEGYHGGNLVGVGSVVEELRYLHDTPTNGWPLVRLANAVFQTAPLRPRTNLTWTIGMPPLDTARVLWVDLRSTRHPDGLDVDWGDGAKARLPGPAGPGWIGLRRPDGAIGKTMRITARQPLPADPSVNWRSFDQRMEFALDERRTRSALAFLPAGRAWGMSTAFPAASERFISLRIPLHFTLPGEQVELAAVLSARETPTPEPAVSLFVAGQLEAGRPRPAHARYKQAFIRQWFLNGPAGDPEMELHITPPAKAGNPLRLHHLGVALLPPE